MPEDDTSYSNIGRQVRIGAAKQWLQRYHHSDQDPYVYTEECGRAAHVIQSLLDELERGER